MSSFVRGESKVYLPTFHGIAINMLQLNILYSFFQLGKIVWPIQPGAKQIIIVVFWCSWLGRFSSSWAT